MRRNNSQVALAVVFGINQLRVEGPASLFAYLRAVTVALYPSKHKNVYPERAKFLHLLVCTAMQFFPQWQASLRLYALQQYKTYSKLYGNDVTRHWKRIK